MAYSNGVYYSPAWVNGQAPAINQSNLSDLNEAIYSSEECLGDMFLTLNDYSSDSNYKLCNGAAVQKALAGNLPEILPVTYGRGGFGTYPEGTTEMVATGYSHNYDDYFFRATSEGTTSVIQYRYFLNDYTDSEWITITGGTSTYHDGTRVWVDIDANEDGYFWAISADGYVVYGNAEGIYDAAYLNDTLVSVSLPRKGLLESSGGSECTMPIIASTTKLYKFNGFDTGYSILGIHPAVTYSFCKIRVLSNGFIYAGWKSANTYYVGISIDGGASLAGGIGSYSDPNADFDVNDNGEAVFMYNWTSSQMKVRRYEGYGLRGTPTVDEIPFLYTMTDGGGITINNNGIVFVDGYSNSGHTQHYYTFYDFRANEILLQAIVSSSNDAFYTKPKLFEDNTTIATVKSGLSLIYTNENHLIETNEGNVLVGYTDSGSHSAGGSAYFGKVYSISNYGSHGVVYLPDSSKINIGSVKANTIGNLYIRATKLTKTDYINWQNNSTKLSAANLTLLGNLIGSRELQVGDFIISCRGDLATGTNGLLLCRGQTISAETYPLLAPKVYAFYGNYKLPDDALGYTKMYGTHLYVKAY